MCSFLMIPLVASRALLVHGTPRAQPSEFEPLSVIVEPLLLKLSQKLRYIASDLATLFGEEQRRCDFKDYG